jgi:hypothetical protein
VAVSCTNPKHPAIQKDGSYCCAEATRAPSHAIFYEPLAKDGRRLNLEAAILDVIENGVPPQESS